MGSYNNEAFKNYNEKSLDACPNCGRTFLSDRLVIHLRSCNKTHGKSESSPEPKSMGASMKGSNGMSSP